MLSRDHCFNSSVCARAVFSREPRYNSTILPRGADLTTCPQVYCGSKRGMFQWTLASWLWGKLGGVWITSTWHSAVLFPYIYRFAITLLFTNEICKAIILSVLRIISHLISHSLNNNNFSITPGWESNDVWTADADKTDI